MPIGQKTGSLKALKQSLSSGAGQGAWIKYVPKNGTMNIRFLQEPEEWVNYNEHFDQALRKSYPCTGETDCPGCQTQERRSNRYLANAVDLDNQRVVPLQLPKDLANRLVVRYEKYGTLMDRDYELSRTGEGLDTTYDLDPGAPTKMRLSQYQPLDLLQVLQESYDNVFGPSGNTNGNGSTTPPDVTKTRAKSAAASRTVAKPVQESDVDEDEAEEQPKPKTRSRAVPASMGTKATKKPEPKFEPEPEDDEDQDEAVPEEPGDDEDDEQVYDEATLKALPLGALRAVARDFGVETKGRKKAEIVQDILDQGEEVDDEDVIPF